MDGDITLTAKNVAVLVEGPDLVLLGGDGEANVVLTGTFEEISELIRYMQRTLRVQATKCPYTFEHTRVWCGNENCREY